MRQSDKIEFRTLTDKNEAADSIIFWPNKQIGWRMEAEKIVDQFKRQSIPTKNLPDALRWHYAKYWTQFGFDLLSYTESDRYILRAIALPIMIKWDEKKCIEIGEKVLKILKQL